MCILFVHTGGPSAGGYRLILASNRDEFYNRPASRAAQWDEDSSVFGGRDLENGFEGGTWLAACPARKRVAALLNLSGVAGKTNALGRGSLVSNYILGNKPTKTYTDELAKDGDQYRLFNLITIEIGEIGSVVSHYSNFDNKTTCYSEGVVGFSNTLPDRPYKKVLKGNIRFEEIVLRHCDNNSKDKLLEELLSLLKWDEVHLPDAEIDKRRTEYSNINVDGLAAVCVKLPGNKYGTRTHTIILVDCEGKVDFWEWTMTHGDTDWIETHLQGQV